MVLAWSIRASISLTKWLLSTAISLVGWTLLLVVILVLLGAGRHFLLDLESGSEGGGGETPVRNASTVQLPVTTHVLHGMLCERNCTETK